MKFTLTLPLLGLVSIVTLLFGLWPLDFWPENQVRWLPEQRGIQFYKQGLSSRTNSGGVVYSELPVVVPRSVPTSEPTTIEIYLESHEGRDTGLAHIVSFHDGYPRSPLVIGQWKSHLVIRCRDNENESRDTYREISLREALRMDEKKLITIASGPDQISIYVDGELARSYSDRSLIKVDHFSGHLNLGNSSIGHNAWAGNIYGLALYDKLLTSEQIRQHHLLWGVDSMNLTATITPEPLIVYDFSEGGGAFVHNRVDNVNHLIIPSTFKPLKTAVELRFWRDIPWDRQTAKDILINLFGFVPFGYCLSLFLMANHYCPVKG